MTRLVKIDVQDSDFFSLNLLPVISRRAKQENDEDDEDTTLFPKVVYKDEFCVFFGYSLCAIEKFTKTPIKLIIFIGISVMKMMKFAATTPSKALPRVSLC